MTWVDSMFATVTELSARAAVLVLLFVGLRWMGRRWVPARFIFLGWVLIAGRMLVPFSVPFGWSPYPVNIPGADAALTAFSSASVMSVQAANPTDAAGTGTQSIEELRPGAAANSRGLRRALAIIWITGLMGMLSARLIAGQQLDRRIQRARRENDPRLLVLFAQEAHALGMRKRIHVVTSAAVRAPAITGLWRARLLMPTGFSDQLSNEELRFVLRHEIGHWRRGDLFAQALLQIALAVHWFNPLAWLATHLARRDCEFACDEFVLRSTPSIQADAYGAALLKAIGAVRQLSQSPLLLGIFENKQQLKRRIKMIMSHKSSDWRRTLAGSAILGLLFLSSFTHGISAEEASGQSITTAAPTPWFENGNRMDSYVVGVDPTQKHAQPYSAYVKSTAPSVEGFGGMMQSFNADDFRGKRVRFSAWLKTVEVPKGANLWLRIDGPYGRSIQLDNMSDRPVKGTSGWTQCSVVLDVPPESTDINLGFFITGTGQAWVNDAKFEIVGSDVATTGPVARKAPENLGFNPMGAN